MSNPAYQNYLTELQNFVNAIGQDSAQDKSDSYSGQRDSNGRPNGIGKMIYADESVYEGQFTHGVRNGSGKSWDSNGKLTGDGVWKNDQIIEGWGILYDENGKYYEGDIKGGKPTGMSVEITSFPVGSDLFIDNKPVGKTPYTGNMIYGSHNIRIEYKGNKTEKIIQLTRGCSANFSLSLGLFTETAFDINLEMVFVEGGTFLMGATDGEGNEKPLHSVTLSDFYIGKFQVTQKQWRAVMGNNPSYFSGCDNHPVENVSWDDVQEFMKRLNQKTEKKYRLLTEAEWEYAARGGKKSKGYTYSGSDNLGDVAWYDGNSGSKTHPVGQKQSNELGLFDMNGNVWEWCSDWLGDYSSEAQTNPKGPSSSSSRVIRGGSWDGYAECCRASNRSTYSPGTRAYHMGFRLFVVP